MTCLVDPSAHGRIERDVEDLDQELARRPVRRAGSSVYFQSLSLGMPTGRAASRILMIAGVHESSPIDVVPGTGRQILSRDPEPRQGKTRGRRVGKSDELLFAGESFDKSIRPGRCVTRASFAPCNKQDRTRHVPRVIHGIVAEAVKTLLHAAPKDQQMGRRERRQVPWHQSDWPPSKATDRTDTRR